jgi:hypothetical protein
MMHALLLAALAAVPIGLMQPPPPAAAAPAAAATTTEDLGYDAFCKKDEREKRRLFRAATPLQQSVLARTQIERWRETHRARQTPEQLAALDELWTLATPQLFERTPEGKARMATFEARASSVFTGTVLDQLSPYGPCIAVVVKRP